MTAPNAPAATRTPSAAERPRVPTRRNTELALIIVALLLVTAYSAAAEYGLINRVTPDFWVVPAMLAVVFIGAHIMVRFLAPYADPVILPCAATGSRRTRAACRRTPRSRRRSSPGRSRAR